MCNGGRRPHYHIIMVLVGTTPSLRWPRLHDIGSSTFTPSRFNRQFLLCCRRKKLKIHARSPTLALLSGIGGTYMQFVIMLFELGAQVRDGGSDNGWFAWIGHLLSLLGYALNIVEAAGVCTLNSVVGSSPYRDDICFTFLVLPLNIDNGTRYTLRRRATHIPKKNTVFFLWPSMWFIWMAVGLD